MKTKEYYIKLIIGRALYFNEYWGDELPNSELVNNTDEAAETLQTYCTLLKKNKKCVENNFEANPTEIKMLVNNIVSLIWGDTPIIRELPSKSNIKTTNGYTCWTDTNSSKHHIHAQDNGFLYIENKPQDVAHYILNDLEKLFEILNSNKHTTNVDKYLHKWYDFPGYEDGSAYIYISEINYKDDKYVFTGGYIFMSTVNNYGDGVQIHDVEDMDFDELPYSDEATTMDELVELLDSKEETTLDAIKSDIVEALNDWWFDDKDFMYDIEQQNGNEIKDEPIDWDHPKSSITIKL